MPQMFLGIGIALGIGNAKAPIVNAPVNVTPPVITGAVTPGSTLTVTPGTWTGTAPISYVYQWDRDGVDIPGETGLTYTVDIADEGHVLQVKETASNAAGSDFQFSFPFEIPVPGQFGFGPRLITRPTIEFGPLGLRLLGTTGVWDANPAPTFAFAWYKNGVVVPGRTQPRYPIRPVDRGQIIHMLVAATNTSGTSLALSNPIIP